MNTLDLHGIRHEDISRILEPEINRLWNSREELKIITGDSSKMKEIVIDILDEYMLVYTIGDFSGMNTGYIKTILE